MKYKIYPVMQAHKEGFIDKSFIMYGYPVGKSYLHTPYGFFVLVAENGDVVMVDSGIYSREELAERNITFYKLDDDNRECVQAIEDLGLGIKPEDVKAIFITHLHWDHSQNLDKFPNAKIYVQKKELQHSIAPYPFERNGCSMFEGTGGPSWLPSILRFHTLEGDIQNVIPGISVVCTPGHSPGSQTVLVDTADGTYAILGDYVHLMENLTEYLPEGIFSSLPEWYDTYPKVMKMFNEDGIKPLCMHEESTYEQRVYG